MSRGQIGRPHYPKLNAPRKRFVLFRFDGEEVSAWDLIVAAAAAAAIYAIVSLFWIAFGAALS